MGSVRKPDEKSETPSEPLDAPSPVDDAASMARQTLEDFPPRADISEEESALSSVPLAASTTTDAQSSKGPAGGKEYAAAQTTSQGAQYGKPQDNTPEGTQYEKPAANAPADIPLDAIDPAASEEAVSEDPEAFLPKLKRSLDADTDLDTQTNYTICAPQLLHLDGEGRPLWFNGWLAKNKFKDAKQSVPATFEVWNMEPPIASKTDAWQLGESNEACLTSEHVTPFTKHERAVLDMVIALAQEVDALGKSKV